MLSADDTALMKQLTGVDEYRARRRYAATFFGRRAVPAVLTIYLYSVQRGRRQRTEPLCAGCGHVAILNDYWDGRSSREARFVELLRARFPRAGVQDLTPVLDELRSGSGAPQIHQAIFGCLACQSVKL